jgi:putative endonuclease
MYYVYILESEKDNRLYKGLTNNLKRRVYEHNIGKMKSTKGYRPWKLLHYEQYEDKEKARKRELYFKTGAGREYIQKIIDPGSTDICLPAGRDPQ